MRVKDSILIFYKGLVVIPKLVDVRLRYHLKIMTVYQTVRYIEKTNCSVARFGDGEFTLAFFEHGIRFQESSKELTEALISVLTCRNPKLLVCVPGCMNSTWYCNFYAKRFWLGWVKNNLHQQTAIKLREYAGNKYVFGDTQITRPYIDWKNSIRAKKLFPMLKKIWDNKRILIVEGRKSRLGVGNDLFENALNIRRILCPEENAFRSREKIIDAVIHHYTGELILIALGPTATVLALDFCNLGMQAMDVGHIDIEYMWYLTGAKERVAISGKYTNEAAGNKERIIPECTDQNYLNQIIAEVN